MLGSSIVGCDVVARLLPIFSFNLVSYGAGLTKMSLQAYALTTFVGMVSPTFALTYLGSAVVTVQWPFMLAGGLLVVVFFFLPKWIVKDRKSWWVCVIQGEPITAAVPADAHMNAERCGWCAKPAE